MSNKTKIKSRRNYKSKVANLVLFLCSALVSLILAEFILRWVAPHNSFMSLVPDATVQRPVPDDMSFFPGIDSTSEHYTNEFGYRSASYFSADRHGVLTIGGSTTYSLGVDDSDSWPWILEELLNNESNSLNYTVGNIGVPAFNSGHHLQQLKYIEPQFENIKTVIILLGINDFLRFLELDDKYYTTRDDSRLFRKSFVRYPRESSPKWYQRTEIWAHSRDLMNLYRVSRTPNQSGMLQSSLSSYRSAKKLDTLPSLDVAIKDYEWNLKQISKISKERNLQVIYVTQPILWYDGMTKEEERLAAIGAPVRNQITYTPAALSKGMQAFNKILIEVAKDENIGLVDLAKELPVNSTIFYDYCHFSKKGNAEVARIINKEIKELGVSEFNTAKNDSLITSQKIGSILR